jgi:hypothetical protein
MAAINMGCHPEHSEGPHAPPRSTAWDLMWSTVSQIELLPNHNHAYCYLTYNCKVYESLRLRIPEEERP